jgi:hypothetical protein
MDRPARGALLAYLILFAALYAGLSQSFSAHDSEGNCAL